MRIAMTEYGGLGYDRLHFHNVERWKVQHLFCQRDFCHICRFSHHYVIDRVEQNTLRLLRSKCR